MTEKGRNNPRLPLHINIRTEIFSTKTNSLRTIWQNSFYLPHILKFLKINAKFKRQILLGILFIVFWICIYGIRHISKVEELPLQNIFQEVDMLTNAFPTEGDGKTTAILLNWSRIENLKIIVRHLCQYSMFKEIMIWNNNGDVHLSDQIFSDTRCHKLRYYNSPGNMYFIARYMACAMATTPYCYFQDDDWVIHHMRSMYANFLRYPDLIHTDTNADAYSLTNWKWCFFDDSIDLHACFSWVGTGAFVSKENVINFLKLTSITEMDPTEFAYGDMYFTTYMNQVPYQLENELQELPQENAFSAGEGRIRNNIYMHKALLHLHDHLSNRTDEFETKELYPTMYQRDVRSPCANDRCLFLTNKNSFPDVRTFLYKPSMNISESERIHESYYGTEHFIKYPYSHAVDGKDSTVWKSFEVIDKDDYIGLDLLFPMPFPLTFTLIVDHHRDYFSTLNIHISYNGVDWIIITQLSQTGLDGKTHLLSCSFQIRETGIRFVKLTSTREWEFPYGVHDFSFHAKSARTK
ncbi:9088_t:CDS:2 [Diversispora eburnea]|uniref:9088_t:CDS:1 n=1 Tax=Diversispora eburnea TaxID=1213867 RepID=A0A9N9GHH7_9GLOM|nr:9088_t:CDS:2 [Diversispora eburnea]